MDSFPTMIHSKMSKIENSLSELNSEILTGVKFLLCLKEDATEIVRKLNSITAPATYLNEFLSVNSFILKYLNFLSEINCKFEMLNISEGKFKESFSTTKALTLQEMSETLDECEADFSNWTFKQKGIDEYELESSADVNIINCVQGKSETKTPKNGITSCKLKSMTTITVTSSHNNKITYDGNYNSNILHGEETKQNNLNVKSEPPKILDENYDAEDSSHYTQLSDMLGEKENVVQSENQPSIENIQWKSVKEVSIPPSIGFHVKTHQNHPEDKTEIPTSGNIQNEDVSANAHANDLEVPLNYNSNKSSGEIKITEESKIEDKEECIIRPEELNKTVGQEYFITIEHITSPSEFYVSIFGKESGLLCKLERMLKLIPVKKTKTNSIKTIKKKAVLKKEIGNYALFYSKCEEKWYRVEIVNWCLNVNDDFVNVFLLDCGEMKCVCVDDLYPMSEYLRKFPALIHRCHLHGIIPVDKDENDDKLSWERAATEKMMSLTEDSKMFRIIVAPSDNFHPSTSLPVTLWLADGESECINQLLVKSKHARWSSNEHELKREIKDDLIIENEKLKDWDPMKEDFDSYLNSYELDMNDPAASIYGYVGKDYDRICRHFARSGFCFKGNACTKEHQKLDPLGITTDQEEIYKNAFNLLPTPPPKSVLNVHVTCLLKFNQFFCISDYGKLSPFEEDLQSLIDFMNTRDNILQMKKLLIPPSAGQIVIAKYSGDQCWYRARILHSEPEKDFYSVVFVDYGNRESMPLSNIRAIEPRYLHLPFQAMKCFIFGIEQNPKAHVKDVLNFMEKKIRDGHISIEVMANLPGEYVSLLVNVFDQNGRNLGQDLIEQEYAVNKKEIIISSESDSVPG